MKIFSNPKLERLVAYLFILYAVISL